jgi:3-phosphoshikimate 1-carboxyvinyltransferase
VEELPDGMIVRGGPPAGGPEQVNSFGDHRVAMALSILALAGKRPVRVRDVACVATSYPSFWEDLARLAPPA